MERSHVHRTSANDTHKVAINNLQDDFQPLLGEDHTTLIPKSLLTVTKDKIVGNLSAVLSCLMYSGCSVSMVLANKAIPMTISGITKDDLPDTAIILFQCIVAVILVSIAKSFQIVDYPGLQWSTVKQWLPVNLFFLAMLTTGFLSLVHASVPMVTIFKNVTNLFTVFGDWYLFKEPASYLTVVSIGIMTMGAILAGMNDLEFTAIGYFWMIMNCLSTSGYVLYMRYASSTIQLPKFGMVYYNNILSALILLPIMFLRNEQRAFMNPAYWNIQFLVVNILAGVLGFYLNFASLWCVSSTSATTYAIVGSVNKVPITILGFLIFKAMMTIEGIIFVTFATLGGFLYAYSKLPKS